MKSKNYSFYDEPHEADDGPMIRSLFADFIQAAGFSAPAWPASYEEALELFRPMTETEPQVCGRFRLQCTIQPELLWVIQDSEHKNALLMVWQFDDGTWRVHIRLDRDYLKKLGAEVIVSNFIREVLTR